MNIFGVPERGRSSADYAQLAFFRSLRHLPSKERKLKFPEKWGCCGALTMGHKIMKFWSHNKHKNKGQSHKFRSIHALVRVREAILNFGKF